MCYFRSTMKTTRPLCTADLHIYIFNRRRLSPSSSWNTKRANVTCLHCDSPSFRQQHYCQSMQYSSSQRHWPLTLDVRVMRFALQVAGQLHQGWESLQLTRENANYVYCTIRAQCNWIWRMLNIICTHSDLHPRINTLCTAVKLFF
jgi:hypothetical protein